LTCPRAYAPGLHSLRRFATVEWILIAPLVVELAANISLT